MWFPLASLVLLGLAGFGAARCRHSGARSALLALGSLCAAVLTVDLALRALDPGLPYRLEHPQPYDDYEGPLGRQGLPSSRTHSVATAVADGRIVFDVHYTLDENGLRVTGGPGGAGTVLFFGCSFTYGFGVNDDETYPSAFYRALHGRHRVVNAAFHGYGPHQMLRAIETRTFDAAISRPVLHAFYLMLDDHLNRAAGLYRWNRHSPRYGIGPDGALRHAGLHSDDPVMRLAHGLENLHGLPERLGRLLQERWIPPVERIRLTVAILARSSRLLEERYGAELTVILWDTAPALDEVERLLGAQGVRTLRVSALVPAIGPVAGDYLPPQDRIRPGVEEHPNPGFHRALGTALAAWATTHVLPGA